MEDFLTHFSYMGIVLVLLAGGFGLPFPEDVPLLVAGYLCHLGYANIWIMVPVTMAAVLSGDLIMYTMGRRYGHIVPHLPILRRYLTPERMAKAQLSFHKHGGKTLFIARFLPGIRTPIFLSAGIFKIPAWKMILFDGSAALISVPTIVLLAYFFGKHIDKIKELIGEVQLSFVGVVVLVLVAVFIVRTIRNRNRVA